MMRPRIIPCLTMVGNKLVKTVKFKDYKYLGDPINAVKIFNEKEVDELILLDIRATVENRSPNFNFIQDIGTECFIPFGYGGGIKTVEDGKKIIRNGAEKIILNSSLENFDLISKLSDAIGTQSIVASIDVKRGRWNKYNVYTNAGTKKIDLDPISLASKLVEAGVGEIIINSIDKDGLMTGYDLDIIQQISKSINVPTVALGGAGSLEDTKLAITKGGASAASAGSLFVYHGPHKSVLLNYPSFDKLTELFSKKEF